MSEIFLCKKCHNTWGGEKNNTSTCPECRGELVSLGISTDIWRQYSLEQREFTKEGFIRNFKSSSNKSNPYDSIESSLRNIDRNIQTIRNIIVMFSSLWILMIVLGIVFALSSR
jgi:hypothetical protein